jgi:hypothetical protein
MSIVYKDKPLGLSDQIRYVNRLRKERTAAIVLEAREGADLLHLNAVHESLCRLQDLES